MRITVRERCTLFALLQEKLDSAAKTKLRKMIKHGVVSVNGSVASHPDILLLPGHVVEIVRLGAERRVKPPFPILYEDRYLIAVDKPPGILSIATESDNENTLYRRLYHYVEEATRGRGRVYIVHRLDREVSGIIMLAKNLETKKALQRKWNETEKLYCALVEGHPPAKEGALRSWLTEGKDLKVYCGPKRPGARLAITHYRVLKRLPHHTLLEIRLETGRKHQIRAHLSDLGCPVVGDAKYGAKGDPVKRIGLHAFRLSFTHPVSRERITLESPIPKAFMKVTG